MKTKLDKAIQAFRGGLNCDFSKYTSKSLKDFIRESNRGNMIFFVGDLQSAMLRL